MRRRAGKGSKGMKQGVKRLLSGLFIILSVAAVFIIAFSNAELSDAWKALGSLDFRWLAGLFLCSAGYVFFDALATWRCLRSQGFSIGLFRTLNINTIGLYYSNITPGASGGQPMQVNCFRKAGIPVGNGTSAVTVRLISNQFMVCLLSLLLLVFNHDFVLRELEGAIWFVRIGWLINFAVVPLMLLAAFRRNLVHSLACRLIGLLAKLRLVRDREGALRKTEETLDTYHSVCRTLLSSPSQVLFQCLCSALSFLALTGSIVFVYHAFGLAGVPWYRILTISFLLFVSASYTPLPGASGAQEGGFLFYFRNVFTGGTSGLALLVWRFFTYYLFLFVGVFTLLAEKLALQRSARKNTRTAG